VSLFLSHAFPLGKQEYMYTEGTRFGQWPRATGMIG